MPHKLIPYKAWLDRTAVFGKPRSSALQELDRQLKQYELLGGQAQLDAVEKALNAWKASKGPGDAWKQNDRNRKHRAFEQLTAQLGPGDTDAAIGEVPASMEADLVNARLGVLYLFSHTRVETGIFSILLEGGLAIMDGALSYAGAGTNDGGWGFGTGGLGNTAAANVQTAIAPALLPGSILLEGGKDAAFTAAAPPGTPPAQQATVRARIQDFYTRVVAWLEDFGKKVFAALQEKFSNVDVSIAAIKNLILACAKAICSTAASYIAAGLDIAKGVLNTIEASYQRYLAWQRGRGVELLSGHPGSIVDAIKQAMNLSICEGLYTTLKGAANVGLASASAGAGMVASIVIAATEAIVKLIWRLVEISHMKKFMAQAGAFWMIRGEPRGIHRHPYEFASWFRKNTINSPALAVLTLNSGICGDKMRFLKMYKDASNVVSQDEFNRGCAFVDGLKVWGADYLGKCGYEFGSDDKVVEGLLKLARSHTAVPSTGRKVWNVVLRVANA